MNLPPPAIVRHITKDHVTIAPAGNYGVTVFNISDEFIEAIVAADDGSETFRLLVEAPGPGRVVKIAKHAPTGIVDIKYSEKPGAG